MSRQQLWQACRKENNNRQSQMTHSRREGDASCSTLAQSVACCTPDVQTELSNCFRNTSDAWRGFLQAPWHHSHYRNILWHREANSNWVWIAEPAERKGVGKLKTGGSSRRSDFSLGCGLCVFFGWQFDSAFRRERSAQLTRPVHVKYIVLAENSPRAALHAVPKLTLAQWKF